MDRFDEMQSFVRVVDSGGISAAAEKMGIAKSAVSRRLQELENRLGVELLRRTTRRIALTEEGRQFYERCVRILDEVAEVENSLINEQQQVQGLLRMAAPLSLPLWPLLGEFMQCHPGVRIDLDLEDRYIDILREGVDLAIRIGQLNDSSLVAKRLAPIRVVLCASPAYLERHGEPQTPEQLSEHQGLSYANLTEQRQWSFTDSSGKEHVGRPSIRMRANNGDVLLQAALDGLGIAVMPRFICYRELASGRLRELLSSYNTEESTAYALYPSRRHLPQRVRLLIDFLAERLGDVPPWEKG
jgi:DNA-binding transcriptional LysR family regulator